MGICGFSLAIVVLSLLIFYRKITIFVEEYADSAIGDADDLGNRILTSLTSEECKPMIRGLIQDFSTMVSQSIFDRFNGMKGGIAKGVNADLKGLTQDVLGKVIENKIGVPGLGSIAEKYMKKHPELAIGLGMLAKNEGGTFAAQPASSPGKLRS